MEKGLKFQFQMLVKELQTLEDIDVSRDAIAYIEDIIKTCGEYVERVTTMEAALTVARYRMEGEEYREYVSNLDRSRRIAHDAIVANTAILCRYCRLANVPLIYTGDLKSRYEVAEFAFMVTAEFFKERQL